MSKNIVICSDGTGNSAGKLHGTNVWRIYTAVDRSHVTKRQITYYDDGVGTDNVRLLRLLGGAFGWGLTRNILQAYAFLAMNYEPGDKVFLFGFSRGAFTVRSLAGLIGRCGLIDREQLISPSLSRTREENLRHVMTAYRSTRKHKIGTYEEYHQKEEQIRTQLGLRFLNPGTIPIQFIGVWDTVDAVGMPFDEMKAVFAYIWARLFEQRLWHFNDNVPHRCIRFAYQAVALDDERKTFHPLLWEPECGHSRKGTCIEQVWFSGMHSNVGGGYPRDGLAHVSLNWMMDKAELHGLEFLQEKRTKYRQEEDVHGHMYNSRTGIQVFYRPKRRNPYIRPRTLPIDAKWGTVLKYATMHIFAPRSHEGVQRSPSRPKIHDSVLERCRRKGNEYAPKVLIDGRNKLFISTAQDGLKQSEIDRLGELEVAHARLHTLFVALLAFIVLRIVTFLYGSFFLWFFQSVTRRTKQIVDTLIPELGSSVGQLTDWWLHLKESFITVDVDSLFTFSESLTSVLEKSFPKIVPSVAEFVTQHPVQVGLFLVILLLVWKGNRLLEVEARLYAFKKWHGYEHVDIPKGLQCTDAILRSKGVGVLLFLFVLYLFLDVLGMSLCILIQIPFSIAIVALVIFLVIWRWRVFER